MATSLKTQLASKGVKVTLKNKDTGEQMKINFPQGKNTVCICRGTACHTHGSRNLLERLKLELGVTDTSEDGGGADKLYMTTADGKYTLRTVACFGQCALAPVVEVNHNILGHVNEQALKREIDHLEGDRRKHAN